MKGKKALLADIFKLTGAHWLTKIYGANYFVCINYHRIYDTVLDTPFDKNVFGPSKQEFLEQMTWVKRNMNVVSENELIQAIENNEKLPKNTVLITFDDGYKDNYTLAYPILKELDLPATFYIPTEIICSRKLGWWDMIAYIVNHTDKKQVTYKDKSLYFDTPQNKESALQYLLYLMKTLESSESEFLIRDIAQLCNVELPDDSLQSNEIMTWDEIIEVSEHNITIGSHTHSHAVLSTQDYQEQLSELKESKHILEQRLKIQVNSVSYPVGGTYTIDDNTAELVEKAGYDIAFTFNTGVNSRVIKDKYNIRRISPNADFDIFKLSFYFPKLFGYASSKSEEFQ